MVEEERPRESADALEGIGTLPEGEEHSEGALVRIADILEAALNVENEHSLAHEVWRIRKAIESLIVRATAIGDFASQMKRPCQSRGLDRAASLIRRLPDRVSVLGMAARLRWRIAAGRTSLLRPLFSRQGPVAGSTAVSVVESPVGEAEAS